MTLPELLVSVVVLATIATVLASAITVTFRTESGTRGRLNVARAEQNIGVYLPADLASADPGTVDTAPGATPCPPDTASCPGLGALPGSNALLLGWTEKTGTGTVVETKVSYRLAPSDDGLTYVLYRIECTRGAGAWSCSAASVLRDLGWPASAGPAPAPFVPGTTPVPAELIQVTLPLEAGSADPDAIDTTNSKNANRIVVTVDGGGDSEGAGGGINRISITAGGTSRTELEADKLTGPSFLQARSRCGGPITLVVDESNSIGSAIGNVHQGVEDFVRALEGTPVQLQIVRLKTTASVLGTSGWTRYFDMSKESDYDELFPLIRGELRGTWPSGGGTNWEDALFRTVFAEGGARYDNDGDPTTQLPELLVFFTDGVPTRDRTGNRTGALDPLPPTLPAPSLPVPPWPTSNGSIYSQVAWDRANHLARQVPSSVRMIGVGVGPDLRGSSWAFVNPGYGVRYNGSNIEVKRDSTSSGWRALPDSVRNANFNTVSRYGSLRGGTVPNETILAKFIVGGDLSSSATGWVESEWNPTLGQWTDVDVADILFPTDWSLFDEALTSIALAECGGTLSLQTRLPSGSPAPVDVTYESGGETVTTGRLAPTATFDFPVTSGDIEVEVRPLGVPGYTVTGWSCRSRGAALPADEWSLITAGVPGDGIRVEVSPNQAVSCASTVAPS
jgi:hypothetical protein